MSQRALQFGPAPPNSELHILRWPTDPEDMILVACRGSLSDSRVRPGPRDDKSVEGGTWIALIRNTTPSEIRTAWLSQKVNRICNSRRRLLAASEKPSPFGVVAVWLARPKIGELILPIIGPGLLRFRTLRADIEIVTL